MEDPILAGYRNSLSGQLNRFPIPFAFPFAPLSLGLFDTDPSRILNILHHQTLLAEEALRYRGVFLGPKEGLRYNPLVDMLSKEHEQLFKRNSFQTRDPFRSYQSMAGLPDLLPATAKSHIPNMNDELMSAKKLQPHADSKDYYNNHHNNNNISNNNNSNNNSSSSDDMIKLRSCENGLSIFSSTERTKNSQKDLIDEILMKRGGTYLKDGIRFNPMSNVADQHKDKTNTISSSLSSASSTSSFKGLPETVLINEASVTISEDESKCNTCNAVFPSTWLLEQHIALQHSSPGSSNEEKSFLCDQYRNALAKHRESQNQRSRIPADKLFTCDVCGMQFRYLKSFKKHRLNHALERIHGKNGKGSNDSSNELVSSSNEMMDDNIDLNGMIKDEEDDDDQNDMIDSMTRDDHMQNPDESQTKISSSEFEEMHPGSGIHSTDSIGSIKVRSPAFLQKSDVESSIPTTTLSGLLRPDTTIGLSAQDTSLINFLRNDVEKQQNKSTPVSRFACPFCGKCVRSKENLKLHVRKHTGERPFVCLFCGRAFGGKSDLTRHLRIHTGERPYHCEACGKCFARADYLSKHLTTHLHNTSR